MAVAATALRALVGLLALVEPAAIPVSVSTVARVAPETWAPLQMLVEVVVARRALCSGWVVTAALVEQTAGSVVVVVDGAERLVEPAPLPPAAALL